jgi:hypothetical protein
VIPKKQPTISLLFIATALPIVSITPVQAKQQCNVAAPANVATYWSWRLIDGRKCWYEGRPGLSKALLEWPVQLPLKTVEELATAGTEKLRDPLNAEAFAPAQPETFEALWQSRIKVR